MYTLDFTVSDWHEGLVANLDNPKIYGINRENLSNQIRIYLDLEENVSYTLDFKSAGSKWYRLMAKGDGYLFYTLQAEDMKRRNFNIQLIATYADGQVKKTPIYKGYDILQSINATDSANDKDASSFKEALMELAKWTKGDKGDTGEKGEKGDKGDKGDAPVKGVDYFTEAEIADIEAEAKADVDSLVTVEAEARANMDAAILENLATETESREKADAELLTQISSIPKFSIEVVEELPTADISDTTVYLVKTSETETGNLYTEYIHVNGAWEELGTQTVDLSDYYQKEETQELLAEKAEKVHSHVVADISDYEPYDDTEVRGLISAESTARAEADSSLQANIDTEAKARTEADSSLQSSLDEESSARQTADTTLATSFDSLSDNIANKYEALANAKVVEIKKYISSPLEANGVGDWIAITSARKNKNPAALDNSRVGGTIYYYDDFATALADYNNCVTTNGSATKSDSSTCSLYIFSGTGGLAIYANIPILTLLADVEYNDANILVNHDGILNLNGHILKTSKAMYLGVWQANNSIMVYGKKAGSKFESSSIPGLVLNGRNNYLYYGDYSINANKAVTKTTGLITVQNGNNNVGKNCVVDIVGVNMTLEYGEQETALSSSVIGVYNRLSYWPSSLIMENVTMTMNGHNSFTYGIMCAGKYSDFNYLKNCTISVTSDDFGGDGKNDHSAIGVETYGNIYIEGCDIDATNCALSCAKGFVRNSILKGGAHGGLYSVTTNTNSTYSPFFKTTTEAVYRNFGNLNDELNTYVQNCTLKKVDKKLKEAYNYSCYISGHMWFDNCTFENEVDSEYKAPAIKVQNGWGQIAPPLPYFSNCKMGSKIRVDSGLTAYFGKGMDENIVVGVGSGNIERTNDTYASVPMVTTQYVESMEDESATT